MRNTLLGLHTYRYAEFSASRRERRRQRADKRTNFQDSGTHGVFCIEDVSGFGGKDHSA